MFIINLLKKVYQVNNIGFYLIFSFLLLLVLFVITLLLGTREKKQMQGRKRKKIVVLKKDEDLQIKQIREDVTMENCILDERLVNYRKRFEEEMSKEIEDWDKMGNSSCDANVMETFEMLDF